MKLCVFILLTLMCLVLSGCNLLNPRTTLRIASLAEAIYHSEPVVIIEGPGGVEIEFREDGSIAGVKGDNRSESGLIQKAGEAAVMLKVVE